jgi:hypothetical protein
MNARPTGNPTPQSGGRGFVLPVVILLVVTLGATCAIMLERHVARTKIVQRQVEAYQEHHGVRSLQTVIEAWRKSPTAQPRSIADMLEDDGLAFSIEPGDGTRISVYLFPGQETMLRRVSGVRGEERNAAERALAILQESVPDQRDRELLLRNAGPLAVDANRADPAVLTAIVRGALGDEPSSRTYERALLAARSRGETIGLQSLANFATEAGISTEQRATLSRMLSVSPEVWRFRVDLRGIGVAAGAGVVARYSGLMTLGSVDPTSTNTFEEPTPFLTWTKEDLDRPRAVE